MYKINSLKIINKMKVVLILALLLAGSICHKNHTKRNSTYKTQKTQTEKIASDFFNKYFQSNFKIASPSPIIYPSPTDMNYPRPPVPAPAKVSYKYPAPSVSKTQYTWTLPAPQSSSESISYSNYRRNSTNVYQQQNKNLKANHNHKPLLSKSNLWKIFDKFNKGYVARDQQCINTSTLTSGCCIKGVYYQEESCWLSIVSITIVGTATIVGLLFCLLAMIGCMTCCAIRRCKKRKIIEMLKKRKEQLKSQVQPQNNQVQAQVQAQTQFQNQQVNQVLPKQVVNQNVPKKCTCPPKTHQKQIVQNVQVLPKTTTQDFGYQPPKLISQQTQVELNNYPRFDEINVQSIQSQPNPYPSFDDFLVRDTKKCTCKRNCNSTFADDINKF
jgi:hypothetical protein